MLERALFSSEVTIRPHTCLTSIQSSAYAHQSLRLEGFHCRGGRAAVDGLCPAAARGTSPHNDRPGRSCPRCSTPRPRSAGGPGGRSRSPAVCSSSTDPRPTAARPRAGRRGRSARHRGPRPRSRRRPSTSAPRSGSSRTRPARRSRHASAPPPACCSCRPGRSSAGTSRGCSRPSNAAPRPADRSDTRGSCPGPAAAMAPPQPRCPQPPPRRRRPAPRGPAPRLCFPPFRPPLHRRDAVGARVGRPG